MADREKILKGIECLVTDDVPCSECPYSEQCDCPASVARDMLELLKEREPVRPEREFSGGGITWWNVCGACKTGINPNDKYCHECGRAVMWDE